MKMKRAVRTILLSSALASFAATAGAEDLSSCDGEGMKRFIGRPVKDMQRVRTEKVRYVCEGCPMTMDFSAQRLTVVYSEKTGRVIKMGSN